MRVKKGDTVEVKVGDNRGTRAKVLVVNAQANTVVVEGVNQVYKHVRRSRRNPQGGRLSMEMPVPVANVMVVCQKCGQTTRVGMRITAAGTKERFCKKCSASLGQIGPAARLKAVSRKA